MKRSQQMQTKSEGIGRIDNVGRVGCVGCLSNAGIVPSASATKVRRGFTLVELLVVIAIIGILISMLAVAIGPVLRRVHDGAVSVEVGQLDLAIENFKNQYGFYPPTFGGTNGISTSAAVLPYLNKMSPNHGELGAMPGTGLSRLDFWWANIGSNLDARSSLVFWLSSVCANKQFPLTGGLGLTNGAMGDPQVPVAFGGDRVVVVSGSGNREDVAMALGSQIDVARDSFFEFRNDQLDNKAVTFTTTPFTSPNLPLGIRVYNTPYGDPAPDKENSYYYVDSSAYDHLTASPFFTYYAANGGSPVPVNAGTFQLYTYGADGLYSPVALDDLSNTNFQFNLDNIANFANGRIETFDWQTNLGLQTNN